MSGLDIFAWIGLAIPVASIIAVLCIAGWLTGQIGHPQAQAVTVAGWVTLICGFALWPLAPLRLPDRAHGGGLGDRRGRNVLLPGAV